MAENVLEGRAALDAMDADGKRAADELARMQLDCPWLYLSRETLTRFADVATAGQADIAVAQLETAT